MLETVLDHAELAADLRHVLDRVVDLADRAEVATSIQAEPRAMEVMLVRVAEAAVGGRAAEVRRGRGDRLTVVGADLERERVRAEQLLAVELRAGRRVDDVLDLAGDLIDLRRIAVLSPVDSVPLLYWTARSRTRWSIEWTSFSAPSAVCTSETASWALRWACAGRRSGRAASR